MALGKLAPASRSALRLHGWLLMLWVAAVGLVTSTLLLHVFHLHSMAIRYAAGAAAIYFVGFIFGGWWYARWWRMRQARAEPDLPLRATAQEELEYDAAQKREAGRFDGLDGLDFVDGGDDPFSAILAAIGIVVALVVVLFAAGALPMLLTDLLAGYLAEIVLEFVIGAAVYRRILRPRPLRGYFGFAFRGSWLAGLFMTVVFGALGYAMQQVDPQATTLLQFFK